MDIRCGKDDVRGVMVTGGSLSSWTQGESVFYRLTGFSSGLFKYCVFLLNCIFSIMSVFYYYRCHYLNCYNTSSDLFSRSI